MNIILLFSLSEDHQFQKDKVYSFKKCRKRKIFQINVIYAASFKG